MTDEKNNDHKHDEDDDFGFPDEGEYQFDESNDFDADDDFSFEEDDFGSFEEEEVVEPEEVPTETPAAEEEVVRADEQPAMTKRPADALDQRRKKTMILGIALSALVVIGGITMFFNSGKQSTTITKPAAQQVSLPTTQPKPTKTAMPITTAPQAEKPTVQAQQGEPPRVMMPAPDTTKPAITTTKPISGTATLEQNTSLLQEAVALNAKSQEQIAGLQRKYSDLTEAIDQIKQQNQKNAEQMQSIEKSVAKLAEETSRLNKALFTVLKKAKKEQVIHRKKVVRKPKPLKRKAVKPAVPRASYYVDAIIPGRAWLKDRQGKTITVSIGDPVPGYGRVTRIDPENGVVRTSSGKTFEYGIREG